MLVVNTPSIEGQRVIKTLGLVRGSTIRARHIGRDIIAIIRMLFGGEVKDYTQMMANSRELALERMLDMAHELGANAVVNVRFSSVAVMQGTAESLAYGTALIVEEI